MSQVIWKFDIQPECTIPVPVGAQLLSVGEQHGEVCLWALVDPEAPTEARHFVAFNAGHSIPDALVLTFVGTVTLQEFGLVFHVFERKS